MIEYGLTLPLIIQASAILVASLGVLAGLLKSKFEACLLFVIFGFAIFFGYPHLTDSLKYFSQLIPGFFIIIDWLYQIDPSLVVSWNGVAEWLVFVLAAVVVWLVLIILLLFGAQSNVIRGAKLLTYEQMNNKLKAQGRSKVPLLIGQFFIPEKLISRSLALIGEPGTGKTFIILRLIYSFVKRGETFFCVDVGGDIYRKIGKREDIIIAPTYENSQQWSPFSEIQSLADCKALASMMVDKAEGESGSWDQKAIDYTTDLLCYCLKKQLTTNRDLIYLVRLAPQAELKIVLNGTSSMRLFENGSEKMLSNIQSIVSQNLSFFDLLDLDAGKGSFSFRRWARKRDKNLWIINDEASQELTMPLRRVGISLVIRESLDLGEDCTRRINVILDELPANGRITSLQNALAQGRKYGLNFQLGFQSLALLYSVYSRDEAHAILGSAGHTVVLRTPDVDTAEYYSRSIGDSVTEREQISISKPNNTVTRQKVRETQRAVMPTEIQSLRDLNGYVKFAGIGWAEIRIPNIKPRNKNQLTPKALDDIASEIIKKPIEPKVINEILDEI